MKKAVIYNDTEVLRIEDEQTQYSSMAEGEFILVQTLPLAKLMLQARGINVSALDSYTE